MPAALRATARAIVLLGLVPEIASGKARLETGQRNRGNGGANEHGDDAIRTAAVAVDVTWDVNVEAEAIHGSAT